MRLRTYYRFSLLAPPALTVLSVGWSTLAEGLGLPAVFSALPRLFASIHLFGALPYLGFAALMWSLLGRVRDERLDLHLWLSPFYFTGVLLTTLLLLAGTDGTPSMAALPALAIAALVVGYSYVFMIYALRFWLVDDRAGR